MYDIHLITDEGVDAKAGEHGALTVLHLKESYPIGVFTGYYHNPEMTNEILGDGTYCSPDVFEPDEDGSFWFVSRNDSVHKCSG